MFEVPRLNDATYSTKNDDYMINQMVNCWNVFAFRTISSNFMHLFFAIDEYFYQFKLEFFHLNALIQQIL